MSMADIFRNACFICLLLMSCESKQPHQHDYRIVMAHPGDRRIGLHLDSAFVEDDTVQLRVSVRNLDTTNWCVLRVRPVRGLIDHLWAVYMTGCTGVTRLTWPDENGG